MPRETTMVFSVVMALVLLGILMVFSTSELSPVTGSLLDRQLRFVLIGFAAMLFASRFNYHHFADKLVYRSMFFFTLLLLVLVLIPGVGTKVDGAQRWLFGFQPSELAKFTLVTLLAVKLTSNREHVKKLFRGFLPPMLTASFFAGLVLLERDLGVPVVMMGVAAIMACVAGVRWIYLGASVVPLAGAVTSLIIFWPHRAVRILAFLRPWDHREDAGWQLIQSMSAFAQGALLGRGAGASEQKLGYLPAAHTDFIFAVVGEELGLVGTLTLVLLFGLLLYAACRIAMNAPDLFGCLMATGIAGLIGVQATFIMMVTTGLLPTKGLPLPFISYGGTSLIMFMTMAGVLANIGLQAQAPEEEPKARIKRRAPAAA